MIQNRVPTLLLSAFAAVLVGCSYTSESSTAPGAASVKWDTTFTYDVAELTSTRLVLRIPSRLYSYCSNSYSSDNQVTTTLKTVTFDAYRDTIQLRLVRNRLWMGGDTSFLGSDGGKVVTYALYSRVSGAGVEGVWDYLAKDTLVPVNLPETDSALRAAQVRIDSTVLGWKYAGGSQRIEIGSTSTIFRCKFADWALSSIANWQRYYAGDYDVTIRQVDDTTLTYTAKDGTVATTKRLNHNSTEYSSSDPKKYPTYIEYDRVSSTSPCPEHQWFYTFIFTYPKSNATARSFPASLAPVKETTQPRFPLAGGMF